MPLNFNKCLLCLRRRTPYIQQIVSRGAGSKKPLKTFVFWLERKKHHLRHCYISKPFTADAMMYHKCQAEQDCTIFPSNPRKKKKRKSVPVACAYSHLDWVVARKLCGPLPRNEGAELQLFPESSLNRLVQTISLEACCDPGGDPSCGPC